MNKQTPIVNEVIAFEDLVQFYNDIENLFERMPVSEVYLLDLSRQSIVISFDSEWKPFIGITHGYNQNEARNFLPYGNLISKIRRKFQSEHRAIKGGRVFIGKDNACYFDENNNKHVFINWILLVRNKEDCDPYKKIKLLMEKYLSKQEVNW